MRFIVPKGYIAVDGTSLTVCEVNHDESWFTFMLVAYTQVSTPGEASEIYPRDPFDVLVPDS